MEKTLTIDGKQVNFKSTAGTAIRYKAQFGRDFFADIMGLHALTKLKISDDELDYDVLKTIDFDIFYNLLWSFAKTADNTIPDPLTWLDEFEEFPVFEIIEEVQDLIEKNLRSSKKK